MVAQFPRNCVNPPEGACTSAAVFPAAFATRRFSPPTRGSPRVGASVSHARVSTFDCLHAWAIHVDYHAACLPIDYRAWNAGGNDSFPTSCAAVILRPRHSAALIDYTGFATPSAYRREDLVTLSPPIIVKRGTNGRITLSERAPPPSGSAHSPAAATTALTSSLSIRRPSRSTTSNRQPCSANVSPSRGKWRKAASASPATVA